MNLLRVCPMHVQALPLCLCYIILARKSFTSGLQFFGCLRLRDLFCHSSISNRESLIRSSIFSFSLVFIFCRKFFLNAHSLHRQRAKPFYPDCSLVLPFSRKDL